MTKQISPLVLMESVPSPKLGDTVAIPEDRVTDWLYVQDGKLIGAYTLRVIYERMSPAQREAFRKQMPYAIDW